MTIKRYRMEAQAEFGQDAWAVEVECPKGEWVRYADLRRVRATPADAEAHLTAIERAAYERGVQSALQHIRTWMELEAEDRGEADAEYPLERQCAPILALLTQEGR